MSVSERNPGEGGALARFQRRLARVPAAHARALREIAQRECESDLRAYDALILRGNALLAATGVALSLMIGLSKERVIETDARRTLFALALVAAAIAVLLIVAGMRIRRVKLRVDSRNIVGEPVSETKDPALWQRDHELSMSLAYLDLRLTISELHAQRARWLNAAQWAYLCFLLLISSLGLAIVLR